MESNDIKNGFPTVILAIKMDEQAKEGKLMMFTCVPIRLGCAGM